jgi:16S rRNA (guanine527-N7)-methyltransferase
LTLSAALAAVSPYQAHLSRPVVAVAQDLEAFVQLLEKWQRVQNLVSRETLKDVWTRHIADSLQILKFVTPKDRLFLDIGSGGGLPAIPLAIALKESVAQFILIEPTSRKASFLRTIGRELSLPISVENKRIEDIDSRETADVDVITSRALASLAALCAMSAPIFRPQTRALFHKGREHVEELAESSAHWHYDVLLAGSDTDPNGVIIELKNLSPKAT